MKYTVGLVADLCADLLFRSQEAPVYGQTEIFVDDYTVEVGGSAAIFASQFTKLGGKLAFLGAVGDDLFGNFLLQRLTELNMDTGLIQRIPEMKTAIGLGLAKGDDRAMLTYSGSLQAINSGHIQNSGILERIDHWHIASYFLLEQLQSYWPVLLPLLRSKGVSISLDTNWAPLENWDVVRDILPLVDVFLPNEAEALHISGQKDLESAGRTLAQQTELVIIKCGAAGALAFTKEEVLRIPVPETLTSDLVIADTTGAGDNFDAGFLYAWLQEKPLMECVQLGIRCGTHSLSALGGIEAQVTSDKISIWNNSSMPL